MNPERAQPGPAAFVVFGITGDLASRKLLPALYQLFKSNLLHEKTAIVGTSRRKISVDELLDRVEVCVLEEQNVCDPKVMQRLKQALHMVQLDPSSDHDYQNLGKFLDQLEDNYGQCMDRLYYLSVPPEAYNEIVRNLGRHKLNASCRHDQAISRLLVEKPFGHDLASAKALFSHTQKYFHETQVFLIDHYLAKETAQNILTFRRHNPIFNETWDGARIESITVRAYEKIGIEGRAQFYESTGALRDFVQSNLLQLLALVTLELPKNYEEGPWLHAAKYKLLQSVSLPKGSLLHVVRGQYAGYLDEAGNPQSHTETIVRLPLRIKNKHWRNTEITVETGKALADKQTDITVTFKSSITDDTNKLIFRIQPNEGIDLKLTAKQPGFENAVEDVDMAFSYQNAFGNGSGAHPDAYERVLIDATKGDRSLFTASQEVIESWRILEPIQKTWHSKGDAKDMVLYQRGVEASTIQLPNQPVKAAS